MAVSTNCPIISYASPSNDVACQPLEDCTGLTCTSSSLDNSSVYFSVNECTDPLEVNVTVYDSLGSVLWTDVVNGNGPLLESDYTVDAFTRTESYMTILVSHVLGKLMKLIIF